MRAFLAIAAFVPLSACGPSDNDPGPGGVTVGEARALDEAAEMIDKRRIPADVLAEQDADAESESAGNAANEQISGEQE